MPPPTSLRAPKRTWLDLYAERVSLRTCSDYEARMTRREIWDLIHSCPQLTLSGLWAPPLIPQSFHKHEWQPSTPQPWESFIRWKGIGYRGQNGKLRLCLPLEPLPDNSRLLTSSNSFMHSSVNKYFLSPSSPPGQQSPPFSKIHYYCFSNWGGLTLCHRNTKLL